MRWIRAWACAAVVVLVGLGHQAAAEPMQQPTEPTNFIHIRPPRIYRLIYRRPRDPSRFYYLLGSSARQPLPASSMPRVRLPVRGASLQWTPRFGGH